MNTKVRKGLLVVGVLVAVVAVTPNIEHYTDLHKQMLHVSKQYEIFCSGNDLVTMPIPNSGLKMGNTKVQPNSPLCTERKN